MCKKHAKDHCLDVESSDDRYVKVSNKMARKIGYLHIQVYYYLAYAIAHCPDAKTKDGRRWLFFSIRKLEKFGFPGVGRNKIYRIITDLLKLGILMARNDINTRKNDKTFLYAVNVEKFNELKEADEEKEEEEGVSDCTTYEEAIETDFGCPRDSLVSPQDDVTIDSFLDIYKSPYPHKNGGFSDSYISSDLEHDPGRKREDTGPAEVTEKTVTSQQLVEPKSPRNSSASSHEQLADGNRSTALMPTATDKSGVTIIPRAAPVQEAGDVQRNIAPRRERDDGNSTASTMGDFGRRANNSNPRALGTNPRAILAAQRYAEQEDPRLKKSDEEMARSTAYLREMIKKAIEKNKSANGSAIRCHGNVQEHVETEDDEVRKQRRKEALAELELMTQRREEKRRQREEQEQQQEQDCAIVALEERKNAGEHDARLHEQKQGGDVSATDPRPSRMSENIPTGEGHNST